MTRISAIVGLGNPGSQYALSRHNAGFQFLDRVAGRAGAKLKFESRFQANVGRAVIAGQTVWLVAPQDYMNNSGNSVVTFASYYKLAPPEFLVAHDELDLPPGAVRLKRDGGHGGHNGLRDIVQRWQSRDFVRLRIGIGHPGSSHLVTSYVLKRAPVEEESLIAEAIDRAMTELDDMVCGHYDKVMNALHAWDQVETPTTKPQS
ncbi:MAG: aminoacyl-tRNA hydrolase [Gammaproteobacteria bacterium]|nr:aminoacyl-tRNA hydrolase [Gammaproteobacteria bacterium]